MNKIAFIYPGQGAQAVGMGADFYEESPLFRELFDEADAAMDFDLKHICFDENEELNQTAYTQPAMVTVCLGITKILKEMGIEPSMTAGLSLGEYAAVSTAGAMSELDAVKLVRRRGLLMQGAMPEGKGAMSAVLGLTEEAILSVIGEMEGVYIANYNCPGQIVITGEKNAVALAGDQLKAAGARRVMPLKVSGAFHSPYMKEASLQLADEIEKVTLTDFRMPYVANVTAKQVTEKAEIGEMFCQGICSSVRWQQSVEAMLDAGIDTFVEIGPGKTLAGFMKRISPKAKVLNVAKVEDLEKIAGELC